MPENMHNENDKEKELKDIAKDFRELDRTEKAMQPLASRRQPHHPFCGGKISAAA